MTASTLYKIAAVLILLFSAGHLLGFSQPPDPSWRINGLVDSMHTSQFDVQGFRRTYWDFFLAAGFTVGVFYLFAAGLAWQLGGVSAQTRSALRPTLWAFAGAFFAITLLGWKYLFALPIAFSLLITLCLGAAAWRSAKPV